MATMLELQKHVDLMSRKFIDGFLQTIDVLSALIGAEERFYEGSHSHFVSEKSEEVARYLGLTDSEIFAVKTAGLLHDIGKIGLPDTLLSKFITEMSADEYKMYANHAMLGREVLKIHDGFDSIAEIVYQHHERLDGSGFPQHLRGDKIEIGAQIISVVNVFHNTMYRRSKDRFQLTSAQSIMNTSNGFLNATQTRYGQVMNHLSQKSDVLYNRKIVDAFISIMEADRRKLGEKTMKRLSVNQLREGMSLVEDSYTSFGLLIAAKGELLNEKMIQSLIRFAEMDEIPIRILVVE